jgi:hypothetical protein
LLRQIGNAVDLDLHAWLTSLASTAVRAGAASKKNAPYTSFIALKCRETYYVVLLFLE